MLALLIVDLLFGVATLVGIRITNSGGGFLINVLSFTVFLAGIFRSSSVLLSYVSVTVEAVSSLSSSVSFKSSSACVIDATFLLSTFRLKGCEIFEEAASLLIMEGCWTFEESNSRVSSSACVIEIACDIEATFLFKDFIFGGEDGS